MTRQIAVRIPEDLAGELDALIEEGGYATTADAVRDALRRLLAERRRQAIDEAIAGGYRRHPPTLAEESWVERSGRDLLEEERW